MRGACFLYLLSACGWALAIGPARAEAAAAAPQAANPTGREVSLTVPVRDGTLYLGDIDITIAADGAIKLPPLRLLALLQPIAGADLIAALKAQASAGSQVDPGALARPDFSLAYDPRKLELQVRIAPEARSLRNLQLIPGADRKVGAYEKPADFSAYLNLNGASDYVWNGSGSGLKSPHFYLDGAIRAQGVVAESQQYWQPGRSDGPSLQRQGSRLVYDDRGNMARWVLGDLRPIAHGFQISPQMAGLAVERIYSELDPQSIARPRGGRSFLLERPSTVEVYVNDRLVRRLELSPGSYNLSDFPFAQGGNEVRLSIRDDAGQMQDLRFSMFIDQSQLGRGRSEFGLYAGVHAPMRAAGPHYTGDWEVSGFFRHGIADNLTLEGSLQADRNARMLGVAGLVSLPVGVIGFSFAGSSLRGGKLGYATMLTFQHQRLLDAARMESFRFSLERRSRDFAAAELSAPNNPYEFEAFGQYTRSFNSRVYAGLSARYSKGRDGRRSVEDYRGILGWQLRPTVGLSAEVFHERSEGGRGFGALLSLTVRLSPTSSLRGNYDSRSTQGRVAYQTSHGDGIGAYNLAADAETSENGRNASLTANYLTNRANLGLSHYATFADGNAGYDEQRTSFRLGTAVAFADGAFSIGRPISNGFAIVTPHKRFGDASVLVDATPYGVQAKTGGLRSALQPNLTPYSTRTIGISAPDATVDADLGKGAFRLFPPYRAGYRLEVGSDRDVSATGKLQDIDGQPLGLATGWLIEVAHPEADRVFVFTNRDGRFALSGLRPGLWRVELQTEPPTSFEIDIGQDATGLVRMGTITVKEEK